MHRRDTRVRIGGQVPYPTGVRKKGFQGDRPGVLSPLDDEGLRSRVYLHPHFYGFTVTQRASLPVTVSPQAVPFAVRGYVYMLLLVPRL